MCHWVNYTHSISLAEKNINFTFESCRLRVHRPIVLAINPDLLQGCQMQKLNGNGTEKLKQKEVKLLLKNLREMKRQFEYKIDPGK